MKEVRTRFAPSPTGYLHLGGLRTALYDYLLSKKSGGKFILRVEDTDQQREVADATQKIYDSMHAAGLDYDEGPDVGGDYGPYVQSERREMYLPYAMQLIDMGVAYPCFCTREELAQRREEAQKRGETFKYDKHCLHMDKEEAKRRMASGEEYVIRQNMPTSGTVSYEDALYGHVEVPCDTLDDNVLIKADGMPTYNFANVIDDHLMGITHVLRGTEYLTSTPKYNLLYDAFGWERPVYVHLPVVMKDQSRKLSKRYGDPGFEDLLAQGYVKEAVINFIALLGWCPDGKVYGDREFFTLPELVEAFDLSGLSKAPSIFNVEKLDWFNGEYIKRMSEEEFLAAVTPWLDKALAGKGIDYARLAQLLHTRTDVLGKVPEQVRFLSELPEYDIALYSHKKMKTDPTIALEALQKALPVLRALEGWDEAAIHDALMALVAQTGMKTGQIMWPVRTALSGLPSTPGGAVEIALLLGKEETLRRMEKGIALLEGAKEEMA